jgi:hypothetical protein
MAGLKDVLREKLTSSRNARMSVVEVDIPNADGSMSPQKVGVLQGSMAIRRKVLSAAGNASDVNALTTAKIAAVIACACDPETRELLFDERDRETLGAQPAGGWLDRVADEAILLFQGPRATKCKCGYVLPPIAKFCPGCAEPVPSPAEVAKGN